MRARRAVCLGGINFAIWNTEPDSTRLVWITMMLASGPDGVVRGSLDELALLARVPRHLVLASLAALALPNQWRDEVIAECPGGWAVYPERDGWDVRDYRRPATTPSMRRAVLARDGMVCGICGEDIAPGDAVHIDHVVPLARGGAHRTENMQPAHAPCNWSKGARL